MSTTHEERLASAEKIPTELQAVELELEGSPQGINPPKCLGSLTLGCFPSSPSSSCYLSCNAKIAGLVSDLHLTGLQYNLCAAIFFITYCLFEVPSNLALKLTSPSKWIPFIMFCWGIVMISMAFVNNFAGLLVYVTDPSGSFCQCLILGSDAAHASSSAGLFPGVTFYLCMRYPRTAQAQRISILSGASALAGAFGGLLAFGIEKMAGIRGLAGWLWIFLLEGLVTTIVALLAFFVMQDYPENATFLTDTERTWLVNTIKNDTTGLSKAFKWKFLWHALRDLHTRLMIGIYLFILIPAYSFVLFLPTIIAESAKTAQLLSVPPNAIGCVLTILSGILSDRVRARGPFVLAGSVTALVGYVVLFATRSPGAGYAGTMVAACGLFPSVALTLAWTGGNVGGDVKKAVVIAMVIGVGNLGGTVRDTTRGTRQRFRASVLLLCITAMLEFARLNMYRKKDALVGAIADSSKGDFEDMGDESPLFRLVYGFSTGLLDTDRVRVQVQKMHEERGSHAGAIELGEREVFEALSTRTVLPVDRLRSLLCDENMHGRAFR
ncbi:hypothetical protein V8D89_005020 [Ganoderma adspersum]